MPLFAKNAPVRVFTRKSARWLRRSSVLMRLGLGTGFVLLGFGLVMALQTHRSVANLHFTCAHGFRAAQLAIYVDDAQVLTANLTGADHRRFGVLKSTGIRGSFARDLRVDPGPHIVKVRIISGNTDQTRMVATGFAVGSTTTVLVKASAQQMSMVANAPRNAPLTPPIESSGLMRLATPLFMSIGGSAISATIGFFIQETLRKAKQA